MLSQTVDLHLMTEVPLGAFLSGGVDSSIVVSLMSRLSKQPVKTHCVGFQQREFDETPFADEIADRFHCDHRNITVSPGITDILPKLIWHMDEPFADASMVPSYYICREARKRVKVCLSGDGGDELFSGYNWYAELLKLNSLDQRLPSLTRRWAGGVSRWLLPPELRGRTFLTNLSSGTGFRHFNLVKCFGDDRIQKLLRWENFDAGPLPENPVIRSHEQQGETDPVKAAQRTDLRTYMVEDILTKVDRMSMAHSLEVRVPILDHKLVEYAFSLPTSLKINPADQRKIIFKKSISKHIPEHFFNRQKQGFSVPLRQWLQKDLRALVEECLLSPQARCLEFFKGKQIRKLWQRMNAPGMWIDLSPQIWTLLCFELWCRQFLGPRPIQKL